MRQGSIFIGYLGALALAGAGCGSDLGGPSILASTIADSTDAGAAGVVNVGDHVKVKVVLTPEGAVARSLDVKGAPKTAGRGKLEGQVTAVDAVAGQVTVVGIAFAVTATTILENLPGDGTLAGLKAGDWVEAKLAAGAGGALEATKLKGGLSEIEGGVSAVSENSVTVLGASIGVLPSTKVKLHKHKDHHEDHGKKHDPDDDDDHDDDKP